MHVSTALFFVSIVSFIVFGAVRVLQRLLANAYFSVLDLVRGFSIPTFGILVRVLVPVVVGAGVRWLGMPEAYPLSVAGTTWGACLLVWPALADRYTIPIELKGRVLEVRVVLIMFVLSYGALGAVGVMLGDLTATPLSESWFGQGIATNLVSTGLVGLVSVLYTALKVRSLQADVEKARQNGALERAKTGSN